MARRRTPRPGARPGPRRRKPPKQRTLAPARPPVADTPLARLEEQARKDIVQLQAARAKGIGLVASERLLARILDQHPEHAADFQAAAEHLSTGDLASPFLHVALHRVVEERVVSRRLNLEMARLGAEKSWHEAVHEEALHVAAELREIS